MNTCHSESITIITITTHEDMRSEVRGQRELSEGSRVDKHDPDRTPLKSSCMDCYYICKVFYILKCGCDCQCSPQIHVRFEMEMQRMKQIHQKELEDKDEELEDVQKSSQRRVRHTE